MKKYAQVMVATVGVVLALLTAAPAHAKDEQGFLDAVAALGYLDQGQALSAGYAVCAMRGQVGQSLTERILRRLLERMNQYGDANNSSPFSDAAVQYLCPRMF
jgi:hypothetical protein